MTGRISFIGAGPGAADLLTLRAAQRIADADVVLWSPSVVEGDCVREHAKAAADLVDYSRISHERVLEIYRTAAVKDLRVVRLHAGDAVLWGAVQEQYDAARKIGLAVEIVPGVSPVSAAAAASGRELAATDSSAPLVLATLEGSAVTMPQPSKIRELAAHGGTMAILLSASRTGQLAEELRAGGYSEDTPIVVAYKTSWSDELLVHTTLAELVAKVKEQKLWRHTLFLVGQAVGETATRPRLYQSGQSLRYRRAVNGSQNSADIAENLLATASIKADSTEKPWWSSREGRPTSGASRYRIAAARRAASTRRENDITAKAEPASAKSEVPPEPASATKSTAAKQTKSTSPTTKTQRADKPAAKGKTKSKAKTSAARSSKSR